ncbi:MAG TPA: leucyl aminopeptidase [Solirubrobacteraceae bacterium]|nr:leucyl aminopeptidase [Solirubrobacteraceae bacterium]
MEVSATTQPAGETTADTIAVGVFVDESIQPGVDGEALTALLDSGEARRTFKHLAVAHADGKRFLIAGLGERARFDAERARVVAGLVYARAKELSTRTLCWALPPDVDDTVGAGLVEGTELAGYVFDRYKASAGDDPDDADSRGRVEELIVSADRDLGPVVEVARIEAEAQNAARELQNTPSNDMTPTRLAERARELGAEIEGLDVEVDGREGILARDMGAFAAVAQGTHQEPALIALRYEGPGAAGPRLGYVGKAVTFDTGGISLKPSAKMHEMKFDMSGGAAVIESVAAIARLRLPLSVVAVVGATENMPSGHAVKPGDIVRASNGTTIEVNNTDAEGRLVLADCITYARREGCERLLDIATLTIVDAVLGSTYAGLMCNDAEWSEQIESLGRSTGELVWPLPLHEEFAAMIKGRYAVLTNRTERREAMPITAAEFLRHFAGDVPWAHLDIAGPASDVPRRYFAGKGATGFGVRLLAAVARAL